MTSCNYCQGKKFKTVVEAKGRKIIKCNYCELITVWPFPSVKLLKDSVNSKNSNFIREYLDEEESYKEYFKQKIKDLLKYYKKGNLLDIGAGPGTFIKIAQYKGFRSLGFDISSEAIKIARQRGLDMRRGQFEDFNPKREFEVVTVFQTLEHILDPQAFLKRCFKVLKKDGILVITTPDKEGLISSLSGKYWFGYYNLEHHYFFTTKTLTNLLEKAGFEIEFCEAERGRILKLDYILHRLTNYYYTKKNLLFYLLNLLERILKNIGTDINIREPRVNIYIIAKKAGKVAGI